jgi:hypothetical protein
LDAEELLGSQKTENVDRGKLAQTTRTPAGENQPRLPVGQNPKGVPPGPGSGLPSKAKKAALTGKVSVSEERLTALEKRVIVLEKEFAGWKRNRFGRGSAVNGIYNARGHNNIGQGIRIVRSPNSPNSPNSPKNPSLVGGAGAHGGENRRGSGAKLPGQLPGRLNARGVNFLNPSGAAGSSGNPVRTDAPNNQTNQPDQKPTIRTAAQG